MGPLSAQNYETDHDRWPLPPRSIIPRVGPRLRVPSSRGECPGKPIPTEPTRSLILGVFLTFHASFINFFS
ncbi:hypothetical protein EUGRSUZ_D02332 [Eucalyptus grandis]|uniref:Uncharacterized protein n=2 Tax=Eucalyptus grandis TaxID=71139 RepID=A0ACC3L7M2_EUCGR|nr:hypothetical protein EUGRSUZ_D02332 [Eucalyptus grandis]